MAIWGIISAGAILAFCLLVIRLYWPMGFYRWSERHGENAAEIYFAHGVMVGFIATAVNAVMLKMGIRLLQYAETPEDKKVLLEVGNMLDLFVILPLVAWACYCHLYSAWLKLPLKVRQDWNWVTRPFYPSTFPLVKLLNSVMRINSRRSEDVHDRR